MSSTLSKLKAATSKVVELPTLTRDLRSSGQIGPDETVLVQIRHVRANEVIAETGTTPLLFSLARERQEGESPAEFAERIRERIADDPDAIRDTQRQQLEMQEAIVRLGVTGVAIVPEGTRPEWDRLRLEKGSDTDVDLLGGDLALVHDEIVRFGSLPYQRMGGAGIEAFPAREAGADSQPRGGDVRPDADAVPQPPAG